MFGLVELSGIERAGPPALTVSGSFDCPEKKKAAQWTAFFGLVELSGIEPLTSTLPVLRSPS